VRYTLTKLGLRIKSVHTQMHAGSPKLQSLMGGAYSFRDSYPMRIARKSLATNDPSGVLGIR